MGLISKESILNCPKDPMLPRCSDCVPTTTNQNCPEYNGGVYARKKSTKPFLRGRYSWNPGVVLNSSTTRFSLPNDINLEDLKGTTRY